MALDMSKFLARFVEEAREHLGQIERGLEALDRDAGDADTLNQVFRSAHTIKGSARMLKLAAISDTAHSMEDVLGAMRDGGLGYAPALGKVLYRAVDAIAVLVQLVARGTPLPAADAALRAALALCAAGQTVSAPQAAAPDAHAGAADTVRVRLDKLDGLIKLMSEVSSSHSRARQRLAEVRDIERLARGGHGAGAAEPLAERLHQFGQALRDDVLAQQLLMDEFHDRVLVMRMLPLAMVFDPAPRMLRELAASQDKRIECVVSGADMELDRQMIDKLGEPVLHLLRNALDHGIEAPAQRVAAGKPATGRISLCARQDGGGVVIEIADDGRGIDVAALREKAVHKGLVTREQAQAMSDAEAAELIFLPGLSTSAIITELSGRGVGMDVVKRCVVDELRGEIGIAATPDGGTVFALRLPLSLAMMRVLLVTAGGMPFGFVAQHVVALLRVPEQELLTLAARRSVAIDKEFVPVVALAALLRLPGQGGASAAPGPNAGSRLLLVLRVRNDRLALLVDELDDERDLVIKPLPEHLRGVALVAGLVGTGRGDLVNVLHAPALLELARAARNETAQAAHDDGTAAAPRILVVDDSMNTREIERDVLEAHGYQVVLADDGQDGLAKAQAQAFDAVLTDIEMPHMNGFVLTERLRQLDAYRDIPIIIITSLEKETDKRRGIEVGADAYIVKGDFERSNLLGVLATLLGHAGRPV